MKKLFLTQWTMVVGAALGLWLSEGAGLGQGLPPQSKQFSGNITNSDGTVPDQATINFTAYLAKDPNHRLYRTNTGCGVEAVLADGTTQYYIECSGFAYTNLFGTNLLYTNIWAVGDTLVMLITNSANPDNLQFISNRFILDTEPFQKGGDVRLVTTPHITVQPAGFTNNVGQNVNLTVTATGTAPLAYEWRRNGGTLPADARYTGGATANLTIANLQATDEASYTVIVRNNYGSVTSVVALLKVVQPPIITIPPVSLVRTQGNTATFSVVATGTQPLSYQWLKNASDIIGATSSTLVLTNVQTTDAGNYSVKVSNLSGTLTNVNTSAQVTLTVLVPPSIITAPVDQNAIVNQTIQFTVIAAGTDLIYQWFKGGVAMADVGNATGSRSNILTLTSVQLVESNTTYFVRISNAAGVTNSPTVTLGVAPTPAPPVVKAGPDSKLVPLGSNATFTVANAYEGYPTPSFQWFSSPSNLLTDGAHFSGTTTPTLTVHQVTADDNGQSYWVLLTNNFPGSAVSTAAVLRVALPPTITAQPASLTVTQGNTASFSVTATGDTNSVLTYQWRLQGTNLPGATSSNLDLVNVQPGQAGNYQVVITNFGGVTNSSLAALTVLVPPAITVPPQNTTVNQGQTATLTVTATGTAPLSYQWQFAGTNLPGATNSSLVQANAQETQGGVYAVVVSNQAGITNSAPATLTVNIPPGILAEPDDLVVTPGLTAQFSVVAKGAAPLSYQWRKDGVNLANGGRIVGATTANLSITSVVSNDAGAYSVVINNFLGGATSRAAILRVVERSIRAVNATVTNGLVEVPLELVGQGNETMLGFSLAYDTNILTYTGITQPSGISVNVNDSLPGHLGFTVRPGEEPSALGGLAPKNGVLPTFPSGQQPIAAVRFTAISIQQRNTELVILCDQPIARFIQGPIVDSLIGNVLPAGYFDAMVTVPGTNELAGVTNTIPRYGLSTHKIRITNPAGSGTNYPPVRLWVSNLGLDSRGRPIRIVNALGLSNGVPYLVYNWPLNDGTALDLTLEYSIPDRKTLPAPQFTWEVLPQALSEPAVAGAPIALTPDRDPVRLYNPVWFNSGAGQTYYMQFRDDVTAPWTTVLLPIPGTGYKMQWFDDGPPKTPTLPPAFRQYQLRTP